MCPICEAGRWAWRNARRPWVWILLIAWGLLTALVHQLTPIAPMVRFELGNAHLSHDRGEFVESRGRKQRLMPRFAGAAPSGMTVFSVAQADDPWAFFGPIRQWDAKRGTLVAEIAPSNMELRTYALGQPLSIVHGDWLAVRSTIPPEIKGDWRHAKRQTEFVHIPTNTIGPKINDHWYRASANHRWIASGAFNIDILDLETQRQRTLRSYYSPDNDFEKREQRAAECHTFSDDGRLLAVSNDKSIIVIDVDHDARAGVIAIGEKPAERDFVAKIALSKDNEAIAWHWDGETAVADIHGGHLTKIPWAEIVGWNTQSELLVIRRGARKPHDRPRLEPALRLEAWNWQIGECVRTWPVPTLDESFPARKPIHARMTEDPSWVVRSPCARKVAFARFVETRVGSPYLLKIHGWLGLPEPPNHFVEVIVLDSDSLLPMTSWSIPMEGSWYDYDLYAFDFTTDGDLFFTDSHSFEVWPIQPRAWFRSAMRAGIATLTLVAVAAIWQFWRRRKRDTISPTPPTANASEVSDAKT